MDNKQKNPYLRILSVIAAGLFIVGLVIAVANAPAYGDGMTADQVFGVGLMGAGFWAFVILMAVKALLWRPGPVASAPSPIVKAETG